MPGNGLDLNRKQNHEGKGGDRERPVNPAPADRQPELP